MRYLALLGLCLCCLLVSNILLAQPPEEKEIDKNAPKVIPLPAIKKDSSTLSPSGIEKPQNNSQPMNKQDSLQSLQNKDEGGAFQLFKELSVVSEDTTQSFLGENKVVKVTEEVRIDSFWVKVAEHYSVINTTEINEVHNKKSVLTDSVKIRLYNPPTGHIWANPLEKVLQTSNFGYRWGGFHGGIDLDLRLNYPVFAVFDGIIEFCNWYYGYGLHIVVRHYNGLTTSYSHLSTIKVEEGQRIKAGQLIGLGGSTGFSFGAHLHFETHLQGYAFNPNLIFDFTKGNQMQVPQNYIFTPKNFPYTQNNRTRVYHTVTLGETLEMIAKKYNISLAMLCKQNQLNANQVIQIGQKLWIK